MAKIIKTIVILSVVSLLAVSVYAYFNANYAKENAYRPMCFYGNSLFYHDSTESEVDISSLERLGKINSCVGAVRKPEKDFECNYENMLGAELYKDENDVFYLKFRNGYTVELESSRTGGEITTVVPFN